MSGDLSVNEAMPLPAAAPEARARVRALETLLEAQQQVLLEPHESLHAGVYTRTLLVPADVVLTGATLKVPTTLIITGRMDITDGARTIKVRGYAVFAGLEGRKCAFAARTDCTMVMVCATGAKTIAEVRRELTDEILQNEKEWQS